MVLLSAVAVDKALDCRLWVEGSKQREEVTEAVSPTVLAAGWPAESFDSELEM